MGRSKGYHPVSLRFGRPDFARFIADTVRAKQPPTLSRFDIELDEARRRPVVMDEVRAD